MKTLYDQLLEKHQALQQQEQAEPTPEHIERVRAFIGEMVGAGALIANARQREQLRGMLRYWSAWIYDRTKEYPQSQLMPPMPSAVAEDQRAKTKSWVTTHPALAVVILAVIALALLGGLAAGVRLLTTIGQPAAHTPTAIVIAVTATRDTTQVAAVSTALNIATQAEAATATADIVQAVDTALARTPPSPTKTPIPPTATNTPVPPKPTKTPIPPTSTPGPSPTPTSTRPPQVLFHLAPRAGAVFGAAFSPDGKLLAAGGGNGLITLWDMTGEEPAVVARLTASASVLAMTFSPDGGYLAAGLMDYSAQAWPIYYALTETLRIGQVINLSGHTASVSSVVFSPDGTLLITGSVDGTLKWWDLGIQKQVYTSTLTYSGSVVSAAFSPDGQLLAYGGTRSEIVIWSVAEKKAVAMLKGTGQAGRSLAFSLDGRYLAAGSYDGSVRLWRRNEANEFAPIPQAVEEKGAGYAVAFSSGGLLAAAKEDGAVDLWRIEPGGGIALTAALRDQHKGPVRSLVFSPDGNWLASGGSDQNIVVWTVR